MPTQFYARLEVRFGRGAVMPEQELRGFIAAHGFSIANLTYRYSAEAAYFEYGMVIRANDPAKACKLSARYGFNHAGSTPAAARAAFAVESCENSPGPFISMEAGIAYGQGLGVQIIFRNNDNPVGGPHEATRSNAMAIIPSDLSYNFPKQPVQGGVGGNPWIFAAFADGAGARVGDETLLGRCEQLSKALAG